jgi:HTH-like domain
VTVARDLARQRQRRSGSKSLSARCANFGRPMRYRGRRLRILPRCERQRGTASALPEAARPPISQMIAFIEKSREALGVEPICRALQFAPSTYYDRRAITHNPDRASARSRSDAAVSIKIDAAWDTNRKLYGARKVLRVLRREGEDVARCTMKRLMRSLGIRGVVRSKKIITTNPDTSLPCPEDKVNRLFVADRPNKLWVSDFT